MAEKCNHAGQKFIKTSEEVREYMEDGKTYISALSQEIKETARKMTANQTQIDSLVAQLALAEKKEGVFSPRSFVKNASTFKQSKS